MKSSKKNVNQKETLIKVLQYIRPYSLLMILTIVMAVISVAFTLYLPIYLCVSCLSALSAQGSAIQTSKLIIFYVKIIVVSDFFINFAC